MRGCGCVENLNFVCWVSLITAACWSTVGGSRKVKFWCAFEVGLVRV